MGARLSTCFKFLPIAVFIILLSLSVRMGDLFYDIKEDKTGFLTTQNAYAREENKTTLVHQTSTTQTLTENELRVLQQLSTRRAELDKRQNELTQKEQELNTLQKKLAEQQQTLKTQEEKLRLLAGNTGLKEHAELIRIYTHMKPTQAAQLLTTLDDTLSVYIIKNIPPVQAAAVLGKMPPEKAQQLTLKIATKAEESE